MKNNIKLIEELLEEIRNITKEQLEQAIKKADEEFNDMLSIEESKRNLKEIINLCEDDIKINNKDTTAILDLEDLKSLKVILEALDKED